MSRRARRQDLTEGPAVTASEIADDPDSFIGTTLRLDPGGGEYTAVLLAVRYRETPVGWVQLHHKRPELPHSTTNVVPGSTPIRVLH